MKISSSTIQAINNVSTRLKIAGALCVGEQTIIRYIGDNKVNGPLTKAAALNIIKAETGFAETEILTEESATV